jgi:hypothetical protein
MELTYRNILYLSLCTKVQPLRRVFLGTPPAPFMALEIMIFGFRSSLEQCHQLLTLCLAQLGWSPRRFPLVQNRHTSVQKGLCILTHRPSSKVQHRRYLVHHLAVFAQHHRMDPPDQAYLPARTRRLMRSESRLG